MFKTGFGVYPDWVLAFLDGFKFAQNIGLAPPCVPANPLFVPLA